MNDGLSRWGAALLALALGLGAHGTTAAQGAITTGPGSTLGGATPGSFAAPGSPSGYAGRFAGRGSLIGDGMGGFTIYQGGGKSRYPGPSAGPGTVHHPGGGTSSVIGDGHGGATVTGPTGTHRHWGAPGRDVSGTR